MADITTKETSSFDLGIENSQVYGNIDAAESFLSEETDPKDIVAATAEDKLKAKEKPEDKKEEKEEPSGKDLAEAFLGDKPEEELETKLKPEDKPEVKETDSPFEDLSEEMYNTGVFTLDDEEEKVLAKTPEEFLELFNKEKNKGVSNVLENFLGKFGEDRRELFEAIYVNGVDPAKYLPVFNEVQNFEGMDLEVEDNQEQIVRSYYTRSGWDKAKVDQKIEKLKSYADLEDEAKNVHPILVQQDKQKLVDIEEESTAKLRNKAAQDQEYKQNISKLLQEKAKLKEFDGIPMDSRSAEKAFDYLYTQKWKLPSGELITDFDKFIIETKNPDNLPSRIKIALLAQNNFDFSKIEKKVITKESNQLFHKLQKTKEKPTASTINNSGW